jgi:calmodulin
MQLSDQEIQDFQLAFQLFDINHDGTITTSELGTALRNLGQNPTEAELQQVILELDRDKNGTIEFDELMELITKNTNRIDPQNECREIFELFDRHQSGK